MDAKHGFLTKFYIEMIIRFFSKLLFFQRKNIIFGNEKIFCPPHFDIFPFWDQDLDLEAGFWKNWDCYGLLWKLLPCEISIQKLLPRFSCSFTLLLNRFKREKRFGKFYSCFGGSIYYKIPWKSYMNWYMTVSWF